MGLLPCPLPCQLSHEDSDFQSHLCSDSSSSSSSSSLYSQPSLPSVPSLTLISQPHEYPSSAFATAHHRCIATLKGHSFYVFSLSIAEKHLFSGSSSGEIRLWPRDPTHQIPQPTHNILSSGHGAVKSVLVSGGKLFSAHQDYKIRVWKIKNDDASDTPNYECIATLPTLGDRFTRIFSAKNYVEVRRHRKCTWVHHVDAVSALAVSRDGSLLYSASWDRTFKVWRTSDFRCLESVWNAHDDAINAIAVSNDGCVYTGSADKKIKAWKKQEGEKKHKLVATLEKHKSAINALALSTDGSILYSGACDRSIIVWEKVNGGDGGEDNHMVLAGALRGHGKAILCLAVAADLVFSGSADKTVRVWRRGPERGYSCLAVLAGHRGPVKCLAAGPDGGSCGDSNSGSGTSYLIYGGGLDCDIKVWQIWVPFV